MLTPLPHGLTIDENPSVLKITKKWFNAGHVFILIFSIIWNAFLIFFYSMIISSFKNSDESNFAFIIMFIFPLGHVAVGVSLFYYGITGMVNKTTIEVVQGLLKVYHHPIPWFGNKDIHSVLIKQLYCSEVYRSTKGGHYYVFDVNVVLTDNKQIKLVKSLSDKAQGLFIENKIEEYLKIKDEQVTGEVNKP
ncbi:MAG: hypothetical protein JXB50_01340 [Spirochaetes bacterium]|nr:hypothetical protein [Spirochaetota bacterium]